MATSGKKKAGVKPKASIPATRPSSAAAPKSKSAPAGLSAKKAAARKVVPAATVRKKKLPSLFGGKERKHFEGVLQALRDKIQKQISFLANDSLNKPDLDEPRDDVTDDFDRDFALNLLTSEHDIMFEIEQALQRLTEGSYGRCELCESAISSARLEAVPFARMCISCQSHREKDRPRYQPFGSTLSETGRSSASPAAGGSEE